MIGKEEREGEEKAKVLKQLAIILVAWLLYSTIILAVGFNWASVYAWAKNIFP